MKQALVGAIQSPAVCDIQPGSLYWIKTFVVERYPVAPGQL